MFKLRNLIGRISNYLISHLRSNIMLVTTALTCWTTLWIRCKYLLQIYNDEVVHNVYCVGNIYVWKIYFQQISTFLLWHNSLPNKHSISLSFFLVISRPTLDDVIKKNDSSPLSILSIRAPKPARGLAPRIFSAPFLLFPTKVDDVNASKKCHDWFRKDKFNVSTALGGWNWNENKFHARNWSFVYHYSKFLFAKNWSFSYKEVKRVVFTSIHARWLSGCIINIFNCQNCDLYF